MSRGLGDVYKRQVLKNNEFFADTTDSEKVYYRLSEKEAIKKAGDYEGNVTFTVSVL